MRIWELWGVYYHHKVVAYFDNKEEAVAFCNSLHGDYFVHRDTFAG